MQLANALIAFAITNYIKLFCVLMPLLSAWNYYNATKHAYILLSELLLELLLAGIMLASVALAKLDCNRIANFLTLPLLLGALYLNWAHQHGKRSLPVDLSSSEIGSESWQASGGGGGANLLPLEQAAKRNSQAIMNHSKTSAYSSSAANSIELALNNALAGLALLHSAANLFSRQLAKVIR